MLVLFETAAGYALFAGDKSALKQVDLLDALKKPEDASRLLKLQSFLKFDSTADALKAATALTEGKLTKELKSFLKESIVDKGLQDSLAVADAKLGGAIKEKLGLTCVADSQVAELMRAIRSQISSLIAGIQQEDIHAMALGLAHSLSRYKLKFSPDKVDTMIVQAVSLLDDIDKELNTYAMRVREWYGWHFPEMGKIITDNLAYARTVVAMGQRTGASKTDLSSILPEEVEAEMREAAAISMGTEISEDDLDNIKYLCEQVISIQEYRNELFEYLKNRMNAIAPNLTVMVGEIVGARLIAHAGSLLNLAKHPASTVQILGAEKALFRALKTKHATPKYGLLYNASIVGQTSQKNKGKISRFLASKTSLVARFDALSDVPNTEIGLEYRAQVDARMRQLDQGAAYRLAAPTTPKGPASISITPAKSYNVNADATTPATEEKKKKKKHKEDKEKPEETPVKAEKRKAEESGAQPEKKKKEAASDDEDEGLNVSTLSAASDGGEKKKKKKKSKDKNKDE